MSKVKDVVSLDTWVVHRRPGFGVVDTFYYEADALAFIEREQGKPHPIWREPMTLTLGRGRTHGKHVYHCWDCGEFFDSLAHMNRPDLDFHDGICHGCVINISYARAFSTWV